MTIRYEERASYRAFLAEKAQIGGSHGFDPLVMPSQLFEFQSHLVAWALRKGRGAVLADCGLGKTFMQLTWAANVAKHTGGRVLVLTPLAVGAQTVGEASKLNIDCTRSLDGKLDGQIIVANYERLHYFRPEDFAGVVCDESSILKSFDGITRHAITAFMRRMPYRLLCTATAAPNDYTELGTSSEALGYLGHIDMLSRFFKQDTNTVATNRHHGNAPKWRFKGHAEGPFWRWVASWARAMRRPSDLGFSDAGFELPALNERQHVVQSNQLAEGMLFALPAVTLQEQREERRRTLHDRCEAAAALATHADPAILWCHLNDEGELLRDLVPGCVEVSGADSDDEKEEKLLAFVRGEARALITKPTIGAWGLNLQHCAHVVTFASHSYEQYYQSVRRCWRFGQKRDVVVDTVTSEGEGRVLANVQAKAAKADRMFTSLVAAMRDALSVEAAPLPPLPDRLPAWMAS